jgi:23S rRNA pseudouridine1911/1915/1917 synthase
MGNHLNKLSGILCVATDSVKTTTPGPQVHLDERSALVHTPAMARRPQTPTRRPHAITPLSRDRILFIDRDLLIVDKPCGVITAPMEANETDTLFDRIRDYLRRRKIPGASWQSMKYVHRIDRATSGLLVFARHEISWRALKEQFRSHDIERRYHALAHGEVNDQRFESVLVPDRGDGLRGTQQARRHSPPGQGKRAITHVRRLQALKGATLIECRLETGRTHQIRIHLAEAGHPLVGEPQYVRDFQGARISAGRLALHAAVLGLQHPRTRRPMRWEQAPPSEFQEIVERLKL